MVTEELVRFVMCLRKRLHGGEL